MKVHYLDGKIASSNQKITVNLVGAGGTGSHMLTNLAILSETLSRLGHPALFVRTFDPDIVTEHNVGRQAFSKSDIGRNKAEVLVSRINRHFGLQWMSHPSKFMELNYSGYVSANFTISCVDSVSSRKEIFQILSRNINPDSYQTYRISGYWMDIGNSMRSGQVILGTLIKTRQPKKSHGASTLKTFFDEYPDIVDEGNEPSCSLADSLFKQDLFINKIMATYAADILWNLLHKFVINYRGVYVNLETLKSTPILI